MISINNDTYVTSLFDSGKYMGTFIVNDKRIPSSYNGNEKLFTLLESAIATTINQILTQLDDNHDRN